MGYVPYTAIVSMHKLKHTGLDLPNNLKRFIMAMRPWLEYDLWRSAATRALVKIECCATLNKMTRLEQLQGVGLRADPCMPRNRSLPRKIGRHCRNAILNGRGYLADNTQRIIPEFCGTRLQQLSRLLCYTVV